MPLRAVPDRATRVGVLGAGTMGAGIAQVAAAAGHAVELVDAHGSALDRSREAIRRSLARDVEKGRLTADQAGDVERRLRYSTVAGDEADAFRTCGLVIEAIVEDLTAKRRAFAGLEAVVSDSCVLATNTSSLSIAGIASGLAHPERVVGVHFFNPATVMPLVEVVGALSSDRAAVTGVRRLLDTWGKTTVEASDTPGFIVNRVARPFYGEALRLLEEGVAETATIDWAMREIGSFRMGPFELMDLIGNDVNYAVSRSVFESLGYDPRYRPSVLQQRMVEAGRLGKKSGAGYYDYGDGQPRPQPSTDRALGCRIVDRVVAMLINEAAEAVRLRVASRDDVDLAMTKGVNYPKGLLAWADEIGVGTVVDRLMALQDEYGEDRYRPSPLLKRMASEGARFYPRADTDR